jgi:hypothetical protein
MDGGDSTAASLLIPVLAPGIIRRYATPASQRRATWRVRPDQTVSPPHAHHLPLVILVSFGGGLISPCTSPIS